MQRKLHKRWVQFLGISDERYARQRLLEVMKASTPERMRAAFDHAVTNRYDRSAAYTTDARERARRVGQMAHARLATFAATLPRSLRKPLGARVRELAATGMGCKEVCIRACDEFAGELEGAIVAWLNAGLDPFVVNVGLIESVAWQSLEDES